MKHRPLSSIFMFSKPEFYDYSVAIDYFDETRYFETKQLLSKTKLNIHLPVAVAIKNAMK